MAKKRRPSGDEERYWKIRIVLEFVKVAAEVAWDIASGGSPFEGRRMLHGYV